MSLINDALKRANQASRQKTDPPQPQGASMQPVDSPRGAVPGRSNVVAILLLVVIGLAGLFFVLWWNTRHQATSVVQRPSERHDSVGTAPVPLSPASPAEALADSKRPRIQINTNIVIRELPATVVETRTPEPLPAVTTTAPVISPAVAARADATVAETAPTPATFPAIKLQGIFFRLKNPEAVVNGKILRVGEVILGARVTRIDRREIVVEWSGQSKTLSLDGP